MLAKKHPNYQDEKQKLQKTLNFIEQYIASNTPIVSTGATTWSAVAISRLKLEMLDNMKLARKEPYFGRVDVQFDDTDKPEILYIGKVGVSDMGVYNWADTKAAEYYFQQQSNDEGKLLLKRTFEIERDNLRSIIDEFVDADLAKTLDIDIEEFTDQLLLKLLAENKGNRLQDIVATIQQQQYQIIQSPLEQLLVVHGVPGSGKTQIALHRVSYLLYHHRDDNLMVPNRVLILGPNPIFMGYINNVLPNLGNRRLLQLTFDDWLIERMGDTLNYETQDKSLEGLLDHEVEQTDRVMRYRNAQIKGSLRMAQVLERYVEFLHSQVLRERTDLVSRFRILGQQWGPVTVSVEQLQGFLEQTRRLPFNLRREALEERLLRHIYQAMVNESPSDVINEDLQKQIRESINSQVRDYFADWPRQNVLVAYRRLLRNPGILYQVAEDILDEWEQELLIQDAPTAQIPFRFSDLAALLYFKILMDGTERVTYDYIVIDEAQDLTPLHFQVLYTHSRNGNMTVLGDLAQSIYPHHSLNSWRDLSSIIPDTSPQVQTIRQSYRSTRQITTFANEMLRRVGLSTEYMAEPVLRDGIKPQKNGFKAKTDLHKHLIDIIEKELSKDRQSIALVTKTTSACKALAESFSQLGFNNYELISSRTATYRAGVVIIPAYLTKGLEFDTVILADADETTYPPDQLHARLLYVVITRPAHSLHLCWTGNLTPMLNEKSNQVSLTPFLGDHVAYEPVTIEAYVQQHPKFTMDWCVERLSGIDKLRLLKDGRIDKTVLDIVLSRYSSGEQQREILVPTLAESLIQTITSQVSNLAASPEPTVDRALLLSQLIFNLLRNQMRQAGLSVPDDNTPALTEQIVWLVTLYKVLKEQDLILSTGRWTTHKRALSGLITVETNKAAERLLQLLIQHGIVEEKTDPRQIRVLPEQVEPLLAIALGHPVDVWEQSLLEQIETLPEPIAIN